MTINQTDRPRFYEQEYLGSGDLNAVVDHARVSRARHDLGAHSWGIAAGLQLIEKTTKSGVDVYVQPGYAWDGFGRPISVLAPYKIPSDSFKSIAFTAGVDDGSPPGHLVDIWLAFAVTPRGGPALGFEACSVDEQYARLFESFRIVVGERPAHADRHAPVTVGVYTVDAEQVPKKLNGATEPPLVDESIAYQTFPDNWDNALWLVPLGAVRWQPPQNPLNAGSFVARNANDITASERKRRFIGLVGETVDAARGFVRVRSRDAAAYAPTVWNTATEQSLLWVEGSLRVEGDAKLLGGQLILRNVMNDDAGGPLAIRRRDTNPTSGIDLWAQIGTAEAGANRFAVGPVTGAGFKERLVVKDDGNVGIGVSNPTVPLTIRAQASSEKLVAFETSAGAPSWTLSHTIANGKAGLNFAEPAGDVRLFLQPGGNVGIGTVDPKHRLEIHGEDNALVIVSDATSGLARNVGVELRATAADGVTYIDFTKGNTDAANSGTPDFSGRLSFNEANTGAFSLRGGKVGIETMSPTNQLHVNDNSGLRVNRLHMSGGNGGVDRWSSLSFNAHRDNANTGWVFPDPAHRAVTIEMDDAFGSPRFHVWSTTSANTQSWTRRLSLDGETGDVSINENGGSCAIGLQSAQCRLHVAGATNASANQVNAHIALIDNLSAGTDADVLALRVAAPSSGQSNNYITFFAGPNDVGAIEGTGTAGVAYQTSSADYAEWLPRGDKEAPMEPGTIVGVFAGRLRRATKGADHILVVSTAPAVVANRPPANDRPRYEKVAMLGQVPALVRGPVRVGDLIVPSGNPDGTGIALRPTEATLEQHATAVGIAWQASQSTAPARVQCAVGLTTTHAWRSVLRAIAEAAAARPAPKGSAAKRAPAKKAAGAKAR
jgi:hypothetical protein